MADRGLRFAPALPGDEAAYAVLREALAARTGEEPLAREVLVSLLRGTLRRFINQRYERKPIVLPMVLEA